MGSTGRNRCGRGARPHQPQRHRSEDALIPLVRAARGYSEKLDLKLVVQDSEKEPLTRFFPHGATSATRNLGLIERAIRSCPGALLAARVGHHLVLDVDTRADGHAALAKHLAHFGDLPDTWEAVTPTGGRHIWFQPTGFRTKGTLAKGVEALYGNRLITLAPSERAGGRYRWVKHPLEVELAAAPSWLCEALRFPAEPKRIESDEDPEVRERRARAYMQKMDGACQGQGGSRQTFLAAMIVTRGFGVDKETAFSILSEWNATSCKPAWSDHDLKRKINEAIRHGMMPWNALLAKSREARAA